jgi:predicted phosphodiesterase
MTTFQIASDLHLEFYEKVTMFTSIIKPSADYLVLAGDIGYPLHANYKQFITDVSQHFKKVFIIAGNHEYYQMSITTLTMDEINKKITDLCNDLPNVTYLNNTSVELNNDIVILGTTLWTNVPTHLKSYIGQHMNDYKHIYKRVNNGILKNITVDDTCALHKKNVEWLKGDINKYQDTNKKLIIVSHHLPSNVFIAEKYKNHPLQNGFVTNLEYLMKEPICVWIAGHTHSNINTEFNKIKCVVNPMGYPNENMDFKNDQVIIIN